MWLSISNEKNKHCKEQVGRIAPLKVYLHEMNKKKIKWELG